MKKSDLLAHILHILNESESSIDGAEMTGADSTRLSLFIEKLYPAAWRRAVKILPLSWFTTQSFATATKVANAPDGTGYVILPDDFLILSKFKMQGWKSSCLEAPEETAAINKKQSNEYLRGTVQRPVCVLRYISHENQLKKALYYYSLPRAANSSTHIVEQAFYIPNVTALEDDVTINEQLFEPLCYICASAVLTSFEKTQQAEKIEAELTKMI